MASPQAREIDAWVRAGGIVVAATERARRSLLAQYHRARRAEGAEAWHTPPIHDLAGFVRQEWDRREGGRLVLNPMQEEALWRGAIAQHNPGAAVLREPLRRMARMAMDAHGLICSHAPRFLEPRARTSWRQDAEAFSRWLAAFDQECRDGSMLSAARLPLELIKLLEDDSAKRAPLLLLGFDRVLPTQHRLFQAWGSARQLETGPPAEHRISYAAADTTAELAACAAWCCDKIATQPDARILVISQDAAQRRGEIERAFFQHGNSDVRFQFEFSLGISLDRLNVIRSAQLLLRWLSGQAIDEAEVDWLFSNWCAATPTHEASQLQRFFRDLRRRGLQRISWTLDALIDQQQRIRTPLPAEWIARMTSAQQTISAIQQRKASPMDWAAHVPQILDAVGWPGSQSLGSVEFQALRRFEDVLELCGSLAFDGRLVDWASFSAEWNDALTETLFAPESEDAPITIAGPAESAGLTADAIWFLGAHEDAWPARGSAHPLLPIDVQRDAHMPHASAQADFELARTITARLTASAREICFSYPRLQEDVETRPSRIVEQLAGTVLPLPAGPKVSDSQTIQVEDAPGTPIAPGEVRGGSSVLTAQSQCAFRGFATARLDAKTWDAAEPGLTPAQRGQLLHEVLHNVWAGAPDGIRNLDSLRAIADLPAFVRGHAERAIQDPKFREIREQTAERFIALEIERLTRVVTKWLEYEAERLPFDVEQTEYEATAKIEGLSFQIRLDRVDRLTDGTMLVIDYKTSDVSPKSWDIPRPDDVQLPLYAGFGLPDAWEIGGLAFARIRAGSTCFAGYLKDSASTIGPVANASSLKKNPLQTDALRNWRAAIETLAHDFLSGRSDINPRDPEKTCARCGLHTLCRVHEQPAPAVDDADEEDADA